MMYKIGNEEVDARLERAALNDGREGIVLTINGWHVLAVTPAGLVRGNNIGGRVGDDVGGVPFPTTDNGHIVETDLSTARKS